MKSYFKIEVYDTHTGKRKIHKVYSDECLGTSGIALDKVRAMYPDEWRYKLDVLWSI